MQPTIFTPRTKIDRVIREYFHSTDDSLATKFKIDCKPKALRAGLGLLDQKYIEAILQRVRGKENDIDDVYGIYLHKDELMFGNKSFDMNEADNIIIDGVRYADTCDLYELIFKRILDDLSLHGRRYAQVQEHAAGDECA